MTEARDFPFDETAAAAYKLHRAGHTIHQKWTCDHCGSRQTMSTPNQFYTHGECKACGQLTDIRRRGCNYLLIMTRAPRATSEEPPY